MLLFEQMIQRDEYSAFSSHRNTVEFGLFEDGLSSQLCRTQYLLSFQLKSKPNWGKADVRRREREESIYYCICDFTKKKKGRRYFHIYIYICMCVYIYINCRIWVHLTEYMKTAYKIIKPLSPLSRDNYSLIILIVTINTILAAAQIYKFLRLESVTIPWLGTFEQSESCCFFYSHPWPSQSH